MIDWYSVSFGALWIFGLGLEVAALSFAYWEKEVTGERLRLILSRPRWGIPLNVAGGIFCLGLAATSGTAWEKVLWCVLAGWYVFQIWGTVRSYKKGNVPK
jgi:hypothetical protein